MVAPKMFWESDRDESLVAKMYGTTELFVHAMDVPDPDAEDRSGYQPEYLADGSVSSQSQSMGDLFPTVDAIDGQFSAGDLGVIGGWTSVVGDSLASSPPVSATPPADRPIEPQPSPAFEAGVDFPSVVGDWGGVDDTPEVSPPVVGDMLPTLEAMDEKLSLKDSVGESGWQPVSSAVTDGKLEQKIGSRYEVRKKTPAFDPDDPIPFGIREPGLGSLPTAGPPNDSRGVRGAPPQHSAGQFHNPQGNFGGKPISGGGMPDVRFSSQQSDGTEFGHASVAAGQGLAIFLNNLTQLLGLAAEVLVDHAQRIKDIEETIERSC